MHSCHIRPAHMGAEGMAGGENAERLAVVRIDGDRLYRKRPCDYLVLPRYPSAMRRRPHHQIPGVEAAGRLAPGAKIFRGVELRFDRGDDGFGDLVLTAKTSARSRS